MNADDTPPASRAESISPWPFRFALAALVCALPLVIFGGFVTTAGAGMAVDGWIDAEGHFMLFFPIEEWMRDYPTFVEHTHRLLGTLVGFFALLAAIFGWRAGGATRWWTLAALVGVIGQGVLGGMRVEEASPELAFVHGGVAQGVTALLGLACLVLSRAWVTSGSSPSVAGRAAATKLTLIAVLVTLLVYAQVWLGAWYRHGLRNFGLEGTDALSVRLHSHLGTAFLVLLAVIFLARRVGAAVDALSADGDARSARRLKQLKVGMHAVVGIQVLLGLAAWMGREHGAAAALEMWIVVGHLVFGVLLLFTTAATVLWSRRLFRPATAAL